MKILGLSAYYHDSATALLDDGNLVAAAQEERFSRIKNDAAFPASAVQYCLDKAGCDLSSIDYVVFYDKPLLKFERILESAIHFSPLGAKMFVGSMPVWLKEKLFLKREIRSQLAQMDRGKFAGQLLFGEHHQSHAASAFYPSPYREAAVLCMDGVGEWATTSLWHGRDNKLDLLWEIKFPHSLGLLYSAVTSYCGFKVNSGEYKLMGLAPFGAPCYVDQIKESLIDIKADGTFRLNMDFFGYGSDMRMTNDNFHRLFGGPPRKPESEIRQKDKDLARSIQVVTEEVVTRLAATAMTETDSKNLCLAGGVALNCVANGKIVKEVTPNLWVQPGAGDAGGAIGAAFSAWHQHLDNARAAQHPDGMSDALLGPDPGDAKEFFDRIGATYETLGDSELCQRVAKELANQSVVGWCQGAMEFGPRALGGRSILADPRDATMQDKLNRAVKRRESFRPFAPVVLAGDCSEYFDLESPSPYMSVVAPALQTANLPAITHVDGTARVQTVDHENSSKLYPLLQAFKKETGCSVLVNTSFNVRGEPIVCSVEDAWRCFMTTDIDVLVVGGLLLRKSEQKSLNQIDSLSVPTSVAMSTKDLRRFGLMMAVMLVLMFGILLPWNIRNMPFSSWPWIIAGFSLGSAILAPVVLRPVAKLWMGLGSKIGRVLSALALIIVYYLVLTPMGLWRRRSRDRQIFGIDPEAKSYRVDSGLSSQNMEKPF